MPSIYVENANAPRHVLGTFMTDHPELVSLFFEDQKRKLSSDLHEVLQDNEQQLLYQTVGDLSE